MPRRYRDDEHAPGLAALSPAPMFAAFYGEFTSTPEIPHEQDHFSLFVAYSDAMGWLTDDNHSGLWGMNDAGGNSYGDGPRAWFQVEVDPVPAGRPLPVLPFLQAAVAVNERLGIGPAEKVLMLLPVHRLGPRSPHAVATMRTAGWFAPLAPEARVSAEVQLALGQGGSREALGCTAADFVRLEQSVVTSLRVTGSAAAPVTPFDDSFWGGPAGATLTVHGSLAAWTPDAVGWVAQALAECASAHGVSDLLFTVTRHEHERA